MATTNVYDNLYTNVKNSLTVVHGDSEYTLGEYMLMKAGKKKESKSSLPVQRAAHSKEKAITAIFTYVNDKLTVKAPPVKDKTMRAFPFRTSFSAIAAAFVACTMLFTGGAVMLNGINSDSGIEIVEQQQQPEEENENCFQVS